MAEVDVSSYPHPDTNTSVFGHLSLSDLINTAQKGRELRAQQTTGQAFQGAMDPNTGVVDKSKLFNVIQKDPYAAMHTPEIQGAVNTADTSTLDLKAKRQGIIMDRLGSLAQKDNVTVGDYMGAVATLAQLGIPQTDLQGLLGDVPDLNTPAGQKKVKERLAVMGNMASGYENASAPTVTGVDEKGRQIFGTRGQANIKAVLPQNEEPSDLAAPSALKQKTGYTTTLPPGSEKSAQAMQDDLQRAGTFAQEMVPWTTALAKVKALGPGGIGPGSEGRQEFSSFVYSLAPELSKWLPFTKSPEKLKDYDEAKKYLVQATQNRAQQIGSGTDMSLATTISGNPNVTMNDLAVQDVIKISMALRRMDQAQILENSKKGAPDYTANSAKWATQQDPRAYAIDLMPKKELEKLHKSLKGKEREKFNNSLRSAISSGVIQAPNQQ